MELLVDAHLAGVDSCVGFTGAVVGIDVSWGEGFDVNESSLGARGDLIGGVDVFGDDVGNDALEYLEHSFRGLSGLPQVGKGGRRSARRVLCRCGACRCCHP